MYKRKGGASRGQLSVERAFFQDREASLQGWSQGMTETWWQEYKSWLIQWQMYRMGRKSSKFRSMINLMINLPGTMTKEAYSRLNQPKKWLEIEAKHMNHFEDWQQRQILLPIIRFFNERNYIWGLSLPNKVLHFLWRLTTTSSPMWQKRKMRGVDVETRWPLCFRLDEDEGLLQAVQGAWSWKFVLFF